ncbi:hypothetical protein [Burkholderia cepacia]|uniref:hypothetical protein n=1 Tax=Burkholderia cepacia TaxID=292 RepID=UPI002ABDCE76|nr:hypothetical protein [Burkholderia cepacia]
MNIVIVNLTSKQEWNGHSCNRAGPEQGKQTYRYRDYPATSGHAGPARGKRRMPVHWRQTEVGAGRFHPHSRHSCLI